MTTPIKDEILELGETYVTLLKSPICPAEVRTAIIKHLDFVRQQLDMTNPELVRSVFSFLAATSSLPVGEIASREVTAQQATATADLLSAAAIAQATTQPVAQPIALPVAAAVAEPAVVVTAPSPAPQPMTVPVAASPIMTPEPVKATSGNLASRLSASGDDREDILS
jgi:hypothetical protein